MTHISATSVSRLQHWMLAFAVGLLAACGNPSGNGSSVQAAPAAPAIAAPAAAAADGAAATGATAAEEAVEETAAGGADIQESAATSAGNEQQLQLASAATAAPDWRFREGNDFKVLTTAQGTTGTPGKIEVTEAFWYGCPHCYQFDPILQDWVKKLPADVSFVRLPVTWNPTHQIHARLFYTAQALGKIDEMHTAIFREIHLENHMLTTESEIQAFFARFGVSADEFQKTFRSFAVESQLKRAKELTERYQIRSVPLLIVDGKYSTDAPGIKSLNDMVAVATELVERERQR
ncbi:MAG: thiol:disulfide interchange protein DsbA/DsbL [Gammaproteobacteria bacterium]|nr:thiol:disulfide interchange protein DsbA/DsbL [Gammaproteobacteria bacterium]